MMIVPSSLFVLLLSYLSSLPSVDGFSFQRSLSSFRSNQYHKNQRGNNNNNNNNSNNNGNLPPNDSNRYFGGMDPNDDDESKDSCMWAIFLVDKTDCGDHDDVDIEEVEKVSMESRKQGDDDDDEYESYNLEWTDIRGGSSDISRKELVAGGQTTWRTSVDFWSSSFSNMVRSCRDSIAKNNPFKSDKAKRAEEEKELLENLKLMKVKKIVAPNSTLLEQRVLTRMGHQAGLLNHPMSPERVQLLARYCKAHYNRAGHVLASVTGATLNGDTQEAVLSVHEPVVNPYAPISIQFVKQMVIDPNNPQNLMTYREYKTSNLKGNNNNAVLPLSQLNTTHVPIPTGRTNPLKLAKAMQLRPGKSFTWNGPSFQKISSKVFAQVFQASPRRMPDGTVQLYVVGQEPPNRNVEYGLSRNLYTGQWEGELQLEHANLLGGGEQLHLDFKRDGAMDALPSISLEYNNDRFGQPGGHSLRIFHDYIATSTPSKKKKNKNRGQTTGNSSTQDNAEELGIQQHTHSEAIFLETNKPKKDELLTKKGGTFTIQNPIPTHYIKSTVSSTSAERTMTRDGKQESILSTSLSFGPFAGYSHIQKTNNVIRANIQSKIVVGSRFLSNTLLLPYSMLTATTRQIIPLLSSSSNSEGNFINKEKLVLAMSQSVISSSHHLPRHEAKAAGVASRIRGYSSSPPLSQSLKTSVELRVPIEYHTSNNKYSLLNLFKDTSLVFFGDWMVGSLDESEDQTSSMTETQSSIGVGFRKNIQGLPLKYDLSYSKEGEFIAFLGIGHDFNVY